MSEKNRPSFFERIFAFVLLIGLWPLLLIIAITIRILDGKPIIFSQERVGYRGQLFIIYKFRTLRNECSKFNKVTIRSRSDPRLTRFGSFMRKSSIDELLQLWNVVRGEMKFVGPRPDMPWAHSTYDPLHWFSKICYYPGLTGWWQVEEKGITAINDPKVIQLDIKSGEDGKSIWKSSRLIILTPFSILRRMRSNSLISI